MPHCRWRRVILDGLAHLALESAQIGPGLFELRVGAIRSRQIQVRLLEGVFRSGLMMTAVGLVAGIAFALALVHLLQSMLHGVGAYDPWTLVTTPVLILLTTLLASWLPARRAARVAVVDALRLED